MKKIITLILFVISLDSCNYPGNGSLGGWDIIVFPMEEKAMDSTLTLFYQKYPQFNVPSEKNYIVNYWKEGGYGFLKGMFFYFEESSTLRAYYVTYIDAGFMVEKPEYARISLRAVYNEDEDRWSTFDDFKKIEQDHIRENFNKDIILRIEKLSKQRSYIQPKDY